MEEVWQSKCSSGWPAQPSSPAAAGSYTQINMNAQQFYPPRVMQAANLGDCQMSQQPFLPSSFNSDLGKSGNSETGNSFLALLSGNSNHLSGELLHCPNSSLGLAKLPISNGDTLGRSTSHSFSANCISPLSKIHCSDAIFNGSLSSFIASWPLFSTSSKALDMQDCKPLRSHSHILGSRKAVTRHSSEDGSGGMGVQSRRCSSPPLSSSAILHQNSPSSQNSPSDATVHGFIPFSNFFMGHPRVLCMNTTGELFLNDMGFLEVLCSCHCLPMSVAKFCQHSGLSSANPGEAIRMESGMALAQWCKMCFGNLASGDLRGLEQSKYSSVERSSFGSKYSSFHSLSKNQGAVNSVESLDGLGRSEELKNNLYSYLPNLMGHTSMEKPVQNDMNYEHEKRNLVVNGLHRIGIEGLAPVPIPVISENNSLHAVKRTSEFMNMKTQHSTSNGQGKNVVTQLFSNDIIFPGNSGNASFSDTPLGPKNFFRRGSDSTQSNSSNEAFGVERSGCDLCLGQPSQHKHSSKSFSSTAMNLLLQNACGSRKLQQQNQLSDKNDCVREVKRARLNQSYPLIEASSTDNRGPVPAGFRTTTPLHNSESEDLLTYAKDSSISLFLSHLTGGTGLLDISNKLHDGISSMTSSIHNDLLSSKENNSLHTGNEISEAGKAPSFSEFDYFNVKGNPSVVITDNGCNIVGSKINSKQIDDRGVGPPFISGQCFHHCPVGMGKSSLFSSKSLRSFHQGTNAKNSNKLGNLFTIDDGCHHNHGSEIQASHRTGLSDCRHSEAPQTCSSINSNYISETSCSSCKRDINFSNHLMDGNLRGSASARHESLMAKCKQLSSSFKMKQHERLCCHSAVEPQWNTCSDFFVDHKDVNYCEIHKNASDLYSLPNCDCNNHFGASHCKCDSAAANKCCTLAASIQSKTPSSAFSSYHICCSDHHICFRPRDILIDTSLDNVQHEMCIHKAGNHPVSGNCCCAIISKCQSGGCSSRGAVSAADTINDPSVNGKLKRLNPTLDVDESFQKERMVGLDQCSCFKKMAVMQNNCQTGFWRDVSGNIIGYSAAPPDNLVKGSEVPRVDRLTETATKKSYTTFEASTSLDEGQMSNFSGSSAPVITEVSVEVNKKEAQVSNIDPIIILNYSEVDEGSAVEKCSSSIEMLDTGKYKEVPDTFCRVLASKSRHDHMPSHSSANIMNEFKIKGSSNQKSAGNSIGRLTDQKNNCRRAQLTSDRELGNRKESSKPFMLDKTFCRSVFHFAPSRPLDSVVEAKCIQSSKRDGVSMHPENVVESTDVVSSGSFNMKRKISDYASPKFISLKKLGNQNLQLKNIKQPTDKSKFSLAMAGKINFTLHKKSHSYQRLNYLNGERPPKYVSLSSIVDSRNDETEASTISKRPVVCGNSGIISSGERNALQKPAKIVPLNLVLKKARRCKSNWEVKHKISLFSKLESADEKDLRCSELSSFKSSDDSGNPYFGKSGVASGKLSMSESQLSDLVLGKAIKGAWYANIRSRSISENKVGISKQWQMNRRSVLFSVDGEALCCVCGSSNQEEINCLLECNQCMIRVHQACYGISKFPQVLWYCRPCKTNSQNIACVLCGYDGGAMTRALRSTNIARSLLKVWKVTVGSTSRKIVFPHENMKDEVLNESSIEAEEAEYDEYSFLPPFGSRSIEACSEDAADIDEGNRKSTIQETYCSAENVNLNNSIIRGACDSSVTQWVHVVCGLWTPGTRCPNVDTMNAFDVFGVSIASKNIVCSVCCRPGGSCIKCRVSNCTVHFHPWCAHQNGLLQSEIEGEDNERVGFYGRCVLHSRKNYHHTESQPMDVEAPCPRTNEWACARTEGFRGRGKGFSLYHQKSSNDRDGCIVSQVQINAWLHINGQKSGMRGVKPACSDVEYDLRKEYIRYELSKGWKRLVVYKSAIHALGLYTSQFIARGAMVVEYVGEIVGLRVADKRETDYQSGRRLQCKSACYFFRIDKEHIIDATRKGGIARFVNHSCLPNCVAKIISIKNEKKVVFFAERDINPGEEITYDYHFNREDEGKKIPCFCNSKNCRRYLN
ncbi:uncharacterized protein LOC110023995 isoform X2 [Phalaenopsis equestris]|uniref:uncharacterized protein LOC110023995 isoform X2 n=1 Tax=Phalaenopsis equestris TaxID=78828 RepID=UPI0009E3E2BA|nr:uncharacterized protein LOC110023995 isoform X2 [Phalaenopsis equestris]